MLIVKELAIKRIKTALKGEDQNLIDKCVKALSECPEALPKTYIVDKGGKNET